MTWKKRAFEKFKLYAVTDIRSAGPSYLDKIAGALRGGADIVQLRATLSDRAFLDLGREARQLTERSQKLLFVNNRADLAIAIRADGVHLGQEDMPVRQAKALAKAAGVSLWVGKSTHSLEQAIAAYEEGADYIGVGPIFSTPTKPGYKPVGLELIGRVAARVPIPFVAIGGINPQNLHEVLEAGARRVAVVRAIFAWDDTEKAARQLREQIENFDKSQV